MCRDHTNLLRPNTKASQSKPSVPLGGHEQSPLLNSSVVILQNPIDEQGATSVESLCKEPTNHERL